MVAKQKLLPIADQAKRIARNNIRLLNCWTGISTNERLDDNEFCNTCEYQPDCIALYLLFAGPSWLHPRNLARRLVKTYGIKSEYMRPKEDAATYYEVINRDIDKYGVPICISCGDRADDVHEIIPRSSFGSNGQKKCFSIDNRCCLCRTCHNVAHSDLWRGKLLHTMSKRYGYAYEDELRRWLIENYISSQ